MNRIIRALVIALGFLRALPATIYLSFGSMTSACIVVAAASWAPVASALSFWCLGYGAWRAFRRQWALHRFMKWVP